MLDGFLMWQGWQEAFGALAMFTMLHALLPISDRQTQQHTIGGVLIASKWLLSLWAREVTVMTAPVVLYTVFDFAFVLAFTVMMLRWRGIWSAFVVLFIAGMTAANFLYYLEIITNKNAYILSRNLLFLASLISINAGIWAARYDSTRILDRFTYRRTRVFTFSGLRIPGALAHI